MTDADLTLRFSDCLKRLSFCRAGWDYDLSREQRMKELADEKAALSQAREIWEQNPSKHEELRLTFKLVQPLATFDEIANHP